MSGWSDFKNSDMWTSNLLSKKNPSREANHYLDQIPGMARENYNPYIERGGRAGGTIEGEYGRMLNPTSFIDDIMKNYKTSAGAQYQHDKLGKGIGATAAAGGFSGTPEHQQEYGEMADKIMSQDMQQYLENALGVHNRGLSGEEGLYNKGFEGSKELSDLLGGTLTSKASGAFQGASQTNADRQALMNSIMKMLSNMAGAGAG